MKIGLLGGTTLARNLGKLYLEAGIKVVFGVRPDFNTEAPEWKALNKLHNRICPIQSAIIQSDIVMICCENNHLSEIGEILEKEDLQGKIILDCTQANGDKNQSSKNLNQIQNAVGRTPFFKAFSHLGLDYLGPDGSHFHQMTYFFGDAEKEKIRVTRLIEVIGFEAIDAGKLSNATAVEKNIKNNKEVSWHNHRDNYNPSLRRIPL